MERINALNMRIDTPILQASVTKKPKKKWGNGQWFVKEGESCGYRIEHFVRLVLHLPFILSLKASVKTSCKPCPVLAEHSAYFAPISFATAAPCSGLTGFRPCALSIRLVWSSPRRSVFVPTNIIGVPSQKWATSGNH
jgi:hypothetical protein